VQKVLLLLNNSVLNYEYWFSCGRQERRRQKDQQHQRLASKLECYCY